MNFSIPVCHTWQALEFYQKNIKTLPKTGAHYKHHWLQKDSLNTPISLHPPSSVLAKRSWRNRAAV